MTTPRPSSRHGRPFLARAAARDERGDVHRLTLRFRFNGYEFSNPLQQAWHEIAVDCRRLDLTLCALTIRNDTRPLPMAPPPRKLPRFIPIVGVIECHGGGECTGHWN
jgi:hypothetical protein